MSDSTDAFPTSKSPPCEARTGGNAAAGTGEQIPSGVACHLSGRIQRVADLTADDRDQMYRLLAAYFAQVTPAGFAHDLREKEWAILLADAETGQIQGFSTLMQLRVAVDGQPVVAFFSGDTVIARPYWGETVLPRLWARHVFSLAAAVRDARPYWFLISSGYKTYRFLPTFFKEFYPTYARPTPPTVQRLLDTLAFAKFPSEYRPARGVVQLARATPLRPGVADITARRLLDPHVAFFLAANPGHGDGDELACITELTPDNLTAAGRRMLMDHQGGGLW
ncbi:MAG: hypothetical protein HY689_03330 [Chloroflexi bacterium]|nr:hypothetical protein [Chloroflexota bacterium]